MSLLKRQAESKRKHIPKATKRMMLAHIKGTFALFQTPARCFIAANSESFLCRKYFTCTVNAAQLPLALLLATVHGFPQGNRISPFLVHVLLLEMDPSSPGDWSLANLSRTLRCSTVIGLCLLTRLHQNQLNTVRFSGMGRGVHSFFFFSAGKASSKCSVSW